MIDVSLAIEHRGVRAAIEEILSRERDIRIVEAIAPSKIARPTGDAPLFVRVLDERVAARHRRNGEIEDVRDQHPSVVLVSNPVAAARRFRGDGWPVAVVALDDAVSDLPFAVRSAAQRRVVLSRSVSRALAEPPRPRRGRWESPRT